MIVFQIQKLSKSFGDKEVLREVSLAVQEKERVGLVGVNGSGKTTLLRCLTGELQPDCGRGDPVLIPVSGLPGADD